MSTFDWCHRPRSIFDRVLEEQQQSNVSLTQTLDMMAQEAKHQTDWQRAANNQNYLHCLPSGNMYERQKESTHDHIPGTCEWVLHHPFFVGWKCGNSSGLLWVSADPGCGKSVKSKALVEERLVTTDSDTTVCYYFFKDTSSEQRSSNKAIAAFLH